MLSKQQKMSRPARFGDMTSLLSKYWLQARNVAGTICGGDYFDIGNKHKQKPKEYGLC